MGGVGLPHHVWPLVLMSMISELFQELLDLLINKERPDDITNKAVHLFVDEIRVAEKSGCIPVAMWELFKDIFAQIRLDTQDIEGINSMIKYMSHISPFIHKVWR